MTTDRPDEGASGKPGSPGVAGEHPNRSDEGAFAPLDEAPDGQTPSDPNESSEDSLPPG